MREILEKGSGREEREREKRREKNEKRGEMEPKSLCTEIEVGEYLDGNSKCRPRLGRLVLECVSRLYLHGSPDGKLRNKSSEDTVYRGPGKGRSPIMAVPTFTDRTRCKEQEMT